MELNYILNVNSIPVLEEELQSIQKKIFSAQSEIETISLLQKEMLIKVRIKQIENIIETDIIDTKN